MTLVKFNNRPRPAFSSLMDEFFGRDSYDSQSPWTLSAKTPAVNIKEAESGFVVEVAAPGLNKEDFKVELDENVLTVSASNETSNEENDEKYFRREFSYTNFVRRFNLPETVNTDAIKATYNNGVLMLDIPKKEVEVKQARKEISIS